MTDAMERAISGAQAFIQKIALGVAESYGGTESDLGPFRLAAERMVEIILAELGRCTTCKRTPGRVRLVNGVVVSDALGWADSESSPCPDCIDGKDWNGLLEALGLEDVILNHSESEGWVSFDGVARLP